MGRDYVTGIIGIIAVIIGLIMSFWPYFAWYLQLGWKLKDASPSDLVLRVERILGIIFVIIGFILIVASCSTGRGADDKWPQQFKAKLDAGQVKEIRIGMMNPIILNEEETNTVIKMIQDAELRPFDSGNAYGASDSGEIIFTDNTSVEMAILGPSGGIELHPEATKKDYEIVSEELKNWFHANYTD